MRIRVEDTFDLTDSQREDPRTYTGASTLLKLPGKTARRVRIARNLRAEAEGKLLRPHLVIAAYRTTRSFDDNAIHLQVKTKWGFSRGYQ